MSQGNSKMAKSQNDVCNKNLIQFEKTKKNRINKKYGKLLSQLSQQRLSFSSLDNEIKFLNQLYFLHQKMADLENCLDETSEMLTEIKESKNIKKSFHQEIKVDNKKQNMIRNLATMVFLSSPDDF